MIEHEHRNLLVKPTILFEPHRFGVAPVRLMMVPMA
jgi:hypothetical protein